MKQALKSASVVLAILIVAASVSCSSDDTIVADTNDTYLDYQVFYDSDLNQTTVTAGFSNGTLLGNEIILSDEESIAFAGDALLYDETQSKYVRNYEGRVVEGDFVFTSSEGKVYTNSLSDYESIAFPDNFSTFSKSEDLAINWVGTSLEIGEHVEVGIGDPEQGSWAGDLFDGEGTSSFQFQ
ncbi:MAG: hypothetical protein AAF391_08375, partial [Bacteroidota bacterium]